MDRSRATSLISTPCRRRPHGPLDFGSIGGGPLAVDEFIVKGMIASRISNLTGLRSTTRLGTAGKKVQLEYFDFYHNATRLANTTLGAGADLTVSYWTYPQVFEFTSAGSLGTVLSITFFSGTLAPGEIRLRGVLMMTAIAFNGPIASDFPDLHTVTKIEWATSASVTHGHMLIPRLGPTPMTRICIFIVCATRLTGPIDLGSIGGAPTAMNGSASDCNYLCRLLGPTSWSTAAGGVTGGNLVLRNVGVDNMNFCDWVIDTATIQDVIIIIIIQYVVLTDLPIITSCSMRPSTAPFPTLMITSPRFRPFSGMTCRTSRRAGCACRQHRSRVSITVSSLGPPVRQSFILSGITRAKNVAITGRDLTALIDDLVTVETFYARRGLPCPAQHRRTADHSAIRVRLHAACSTSWP
jgi:hypothetical protein